MQIRLGDLKKAILEKRSKGETWVEIGSTVGLNPETVMGLAQNANKHLEKAWFTLGSDGPERTAD